MRWIPSILSPTKVGPHLQRYTQSVRLIVLYVGTCFLHSLPVEVRVNDISGRRAVLGTIRQFLTCFLTL